jgi:hypothetical protein
VLARFERSLYLRTSRGELVCLGFVEIGAGPLNVQCDPGAAPPWHALGIERGAAGRVEGSILLLGRVRIELGDAICWSPPPLSGVPWTERLPAGLALIDETARSEAPADGLAPLLDEVSGRPSRVDSALLRAARPGVRCLCERPGSALDCRRGRAGSAADPCAAIRGLVGLGPGLTPSGDDVLAGTLVALRAFGAGARADALGRLALDAAREGTGPISRAHLECAAVGEGAEALHGVLSGLAAGTPAGLREAIRGLVRIGHTSGWDALLGLRCAGAVVIGAGDAAPRSAPGPG